MKVTIITASKNSGRTLEGNLKSVLGQSHPAIEHIVVDGGSTDVSEGILNRYLRPELKVIRGRDKSMYDAINKGLAVSSGEVVAVLNSDDVFEDADVIKDVVAQFTQSDADSVYGDIVYVRQDNIERVVRYWRSGRGGRQQLERGWTPPHTAFFVRKSAYDKSGPYDISYRIASDYEMTLRLLYKFNITTAYLPRVCTRMRLGGMSNRDIPSMLKKSSEDLRACMSHGLPHPRVTVAMKNFRKLSQFVCRAEGGR